MASSSVRGTHAGSSSTAAFHAASVSGTRPTTAAALNGVHGSGKDNPKHAPCSGTDATSSLKPRRLSVADSFPKCTVGCPVLDVFLRGGIPCGSITELVGESTSAKTQFCLQMALAVQAPPSVGGMGGRSLYIFTEGYFPIRRLWQMASTLRKPNQFINTNATSGSFCPSRPCGSHRPPCPSDADATRLMARAPFQRLSQEPLFHSTNARIHREQDPSGEECARIACSNVLVEGIHTPEELLSLLKHLRSSFWNNSGHALPVRMIIIDSITALFRSEYDNTISDMSNRASVLFQIARELKRIASEFRIPVLLTNQVTDYVESDGTDGSNVSGARIGNLSYMLTSSRRVVAALGLAWCSCVTTRLFLSRSSSAYSSSFDGCGMQIKRRIQVVFAPHLPPTSCEFLVERCGLRGLVS